MERASVNGRQSAPRAGKILGILGGLGPYAHLDLERKLLTAARELAGVVREQDYPEWILSSVPRTPDRTEAIRGEGPSPLPWLVRGLRRLEGRRGAAGEEVPGADLVIVACNTAHHYLEDLRRATELPLLDMIGECAAVLGGCLAAGSRIGLLATTGTLESGLYHRALGARGLAARSLFDTDDGGERQERWVMEAIYGSAEEGEPGLKTGGGRRTGGRRPGSRRRARSLLLEAAAVLVDELDCRALVAACTEIPLALPEREVSGVPLVDPVDLVARAAIARVYGF